MASSSIKAISTTSPFKASSSASSQPPSSSKPSLLSFLHTSSSNPISLKLSHSHAHNSHSHSFLITNVLKTVDSSETSVSKSQNLKPTSSDSTPTILVSEKLGEAGLQVLRGFGNLECAYNLSPEELCAKISTCDALIVRSGTKVTRQVFEAAKGRLKVVGRAGVGIDNVDLQAATEFGCLVVNAPTANTVAAAEHGIALLTAMSRNVAQADASIKAGMNYKQPFFYL